MGFLFCFCLFLIKLYASQESPFDVRGNYDLKSWDDSFYFNPYKNLSYALKIWTPKISGIYPMILFFTGFEGFAPTFVYSNILSHIASYGYIVVSASNFSYDTNATTNAIDLIKVVDWMNHNLTDNINDHGLSNVYPNTSSFAISCQSSGCHAAASLLTISCININSAIFIDPVDCSNPEIPRYCLTVPGNKLSFYIPLLHIENGLDPTSVNKLYPPCAPNDMSNQRWINSWNGPVYQINATMYGHMDCADEIFSPVFSEVCPSCESVYGKNNCNNDYRNGIGGWSVSFLNILYKQENQYLQYITQNNWLNISLIMNQYYTQDPLQPICKNL